VVGDQSRSGLLRGSLVPPEAIRNLRAIGRYHQRTGAMPAMEKNRLVRVLAEGGIRITAVVSDPHGVAATAPIDCLLDGGTPEQARVCAGRLHAPREELPAALEGEFSEAHRLVAQTIRTPIRFLQAQRADLETRLLAGAIPYEAALSLLLTIPGIDQLGAVRSLVEIGDDMTAFGSAGRWARWCGVCPGNNESAGKRGRGKTTKANRYVRALWCEIAWAASRTTSRFTDRFRDRVARRGTQRAVIAIAHRIARVVFAVLSRRVPYQDSTVDDQALAVMKRAPRRIRQPKQYNWLPVTA